MHLYDIIVSALHQLLTGGFAPRVTRGSGRLRNFFVVVIQSLKKIPDIFLGPIRNYTGNKNHIGSAVSEIIWYRQTCKRICKV